MTHIKSYTEFLNEDLSGKYSYYGPGSLYPLAAKLAAEGKSAKQISLYLTTIGVSDAKRLEVLNLLFNSTQAESVAIPTNIVLEGKDILDADAKDLSKGIDPDKSKSDTDVKSALDKIKKEKDDTDDKSDSNDNVKALQAVLNDAAKLEKIKKILLESRNK